MYKWQLVKETETERIYEHQGSPLRIKCTLEMIYNGEEGRYWVFKNPFEMPIQRKHVYEVIRQYKDIGIGKEHLTERLEAIIKANQDGNSNLVYHESQNLIDKIKDVKGDIEVIQLITAFYIMADDELIDDFDVDLAYKKLDLWKKNTELFNFFLECAYKKMMILTPDLLNITQNYSEKPNPKVASLQPLK